ncbi:hypothetical protein FJT64_017804 [Amphibalanus amphitrite]|uniref:Uncharacterized protein n=1 Tax=Amphibalanus amphitrite TaxID=1232801 RepID=A0A6A4X1J6_AMPAM|nr:hypothetical protein FJT64_017804 [Amphibalanus amphitrite]
MGVVTAPSARFQLPIYRQGVLVLLLLTVAVASADYRDDIYSPTSYVRSTGSSVIRRGSDGYARLQPGAAGASHYRDTMVTLN